MPSLRTPSYVRNLVKRSRRWGQIGSIGGFVLTAYGIATSLGQETLSTHDVLLIIAGIYATIFFGGVVLGKELTSEMEGVRETIETHADCLYLGRPDEIVTICAARLKKATKIRNTFVAFRIPNDADVQKYLSDNPRADIVKSQSWEDIFSEESLSFNSLRTFLNSTAANRYSAYVLRRPYPIVNFVLLEYGEQEPEVLFGWGFHHKDKIGSIYASKGLYSLFNRYWEALSDDSVPLRVEGRLCLTRYEIKGLWLTVAVSGHATGNIRAKSPLNVALTLIKIDDAQRIAVEIRRYKLTSGSTVDTSSVYQTVISKASYLRESELWFVAEVHGKLTAGSYNFVQKENSGQKEWCFFSNFIEEGNANVIGVYGRKLASLAAFPDDPTTTSNYLNSYDAQVLSFWNREEASRSGEQGQQAAFSSVDGSPNTQDDADRSEKT